MSVQRLLTQGLSGLVEYVATLVSTGVGSSGQIPALGPLGTLDSSTLPLATSALALAGTDTTTVMTPAQTAAVLSAARLDSGADNDMATNGVFGIGVGVIANTDRALASQVVTQVSDLGLASQTVTQTIDLGKASA